MLEDDIPHLPDLIRFRQRPLGLQVQNLLNAGHAEDMMISSDSFIKAKPDKEMA